MSEGAFDYVFVSHANDDKASISPIVAALVEEGIPTWIDDPKKLTCSDAVKAELLRLHADDTPYPQQLDKAVDHCACLLACFSKQIFAKGDAPFAGRGEWLREIVKGEGRTVFCRLDDVDREKLGDRYRNAQMESLTIRGGRVETDLSQLISDIRRTMQANLNRYQIPTVSREVDAQDLNMVGRRAEETDIVNAVREGADVRRVYPLIMSAPANELPDMFLRRLARSLKARFEAVTWTEYQVPWPEAEQDIRATFLGRLGHGISSRDNSVGAIAETLSRMAHPTVVIARMSSLDWTDQEPARIRSWVETCEEIVPDTRTGNFIPLLVIALPDAEAGWQLSNRRENRVPGGGWGPFASRSARIWRMLLSLERSLNAAGKTRLFVAPILPPIEYTEAAAWATREGRSESEANTKLAAIEDLYKAPRTRQHGIVHQTFRNHFLGLDRPRKGNPV